jgi:pimeloyl-ACP methyl ester carboxylesterase
MNVVVDGLMTNYLKTGNGKRTIVMLPGWGDTSKTFTQLASALGADYTVLAVDLPGFGGTQAPEQAWGLEDYAKFVSHWLKKLGVSQVYAFVGHSHGGATAVYGIGEKILLSDKLVLLASAGVRNQQSARTKLLWAGAKAGKLPLMLLPGSKRETIRKRFYGAAGSDILLLPHMEQTFRKIISQDVQASAARIKVPTLLIYGSKDKSTPIKYGHMLNRSIQGSRLELLSAGHFVHQDEAVKVAGLVRNFLSDN